MIADVGNAIPANSREIDAKPQTLGNKRYYHIDGDRMSRIGGGAIQLLCCCEGV
jgi:hypothetical protein